MTPDKVAVPSVRADGTIDQTPGWTDMNGTPGSGPVEMVVPDPVPEVPASPAVQDVVDALVTLGLVTQAA